MLIDLSKVLSEPHRPIHEVVTWDFKDIQSRMGKFPIISKDDVIVDVKWKKQEKRARFLGIMFLIVSVPIFIAMITGNLE